MEKNFGKDMTTGSIPRHLLAMSVPMLIGNLLNIGYSLVNTMWVGNFLGKDAVGATAVSFPIVFILIGIASGVTMATTILVSQYYGARDYKMVERVVNNSFSVALILGVLLTAGGIISGDSILRLMQTPEEIFVMASGYLKISLVGFVLMYLGFLISSILRGIGDTVTPLAFMGIGVAINAILDPLLILGIGPFPRLGLNGAAYASLIAQVIGTALALLYLNRKKHMVAFHPANLIFDKQLTLLIFKIGLPSMVQQSLVSIGSAVVTSLVNSFGASATAAFGAAARIDSVAFMPAMSLGMAASALTGQNLGAGKPERVKEIFKWGVIMTSCIILAISLLVVILPRLILSLFVHETDVLDIGVSYLRIVGSGYILFAVMFISNGIINGAGHTMTTMAFSLVSLWLIRVPLAAALAKTALGTTGIWIAMDVSFAIVMLVSLAYYYSGRWKKAVIRHRPAAPQPEPE